jgi:hypothetical protein
MMLDQLIDIFITITHIELMVPIGLGVPLADDIGIGVNW